MANRRRRFKQTQSLHERLQAFAQEARPKRPAFRPGRSEINC